LSVTEQQQINWVLSFFNIIVIVKLPVPITKACSLKLMTECNGYKRTVAREPYAQSRCVESSSVLNLVRLSLTYAPTIACLDCTLKIGKKSCFPLMQKLKFYIYYLGVT
jgi:hypothetical protein